MTDDRKNALALALPPYLTLSLALAAPTQALLYNFF